MILLNDKGYYIVTFTNSQSMNLYLSNYQDSKFINPSVRYSQIEMKIHVNVTFENVKNYFDCYSDILRSFQNNSYFNLYDSFIRKEKTKRLMYSITHSYEESINSLIRRIGNTCKHCIVIEVKK